ncbi:hypothetical protein PR048_024764 [Dryococelus australis]|uniref:Uncharacterized protein n=1 Tax=Dryococelus australis TaxID=614101 RepID=A0ABQ9GPF7_9NEOP|nr:hypothetical protein PR048_024764 [Dryococelus australis]
MARKWGRRGAGEPAGSSLLEWYGVVPGVEAQHWGWLYKHRRLKPPVTRTQLCHIVDNTLTVDVRGARVGPASLTILLSLLRYQRRAIMMTPKNQIKEHIKSFPHQESHHSSGSSSQYLSEDLNLTVMFNLFQ